MAVSHMLSKRFDLPRFAFLGKAFWRASAFGGTMGHDVFLDHI